MSCNQCVRYAKSSVELPSSSMAAAAANIENAASKLNAFEAFEANLGVPNRCFRHPDDTIQYLCDSPDCPNRFLCDKCLVEHQLSATHVIKPIKQFDSKSIQNDCEAMLANYQFKTVHLRNLIKFFEASMIKLLNKQTERKLKTTEHYEEIKCYVIEKFNRISELMNHEFEESKQKIVDVVSEIQERIAVISTYCEGIQVIIQDGNNNYDHNQHDLFLNYRSVLTKFESFCANDCDFETRMNSFISSQINDNDIDTSNSALALEFNQMGINDSSSVDGNSVESVKAIKEVSEMSIRVQFGNLGPSRGQFRSPNGFCLSPKEEIIVADTLNHRIQFFDKNGVYLDCFGAAGREDGFFWFPRKVAMFSSTQDLVISDRGRERSRVQIFSRYGHYLRKIQLPKIDIIAGLIILPQTEDIVIMDSVRPTIIIYSKTGAWKKNLDCSSFIIEPSDLTYFDNKFYICDFKGHEVIVLNTDGAVLKKIGSTQITNYPNGIEISENGDILIGDSHGNKFHIAIFNLEGELTGEFECPTIKVSRCCGLKLSSEGYIITLAKNNNHVLILNTIYMP